MSFIIHYVHRADFLNKGPISRHVFSIVVRNYKDLLVAQTRDDIEVISIKENVYFNFPFRYPIQPVGPIDEVDNWGAVFLNAKRFLELNATGAGVRVGIIDSGLDPSHGCFAGINLAKFVEVDKDSGSIKEIEPYDSQWHGTFCAAIVAGRVHNGSYRGMAPDAELYIAKVFDKQWGSSTVAIESAFRFCIDNKVNLISMSLGIPNQDDVWLPIVMEFLASGGVLIAGIGNDFEGEGPTISPGNYPGTGILSVGAHDVDQEVWKKSGGGEIIWPQSLPFTDPVKVIKPDIVAPGVGVISIGKEASMEVSEGTSFATPHIAGLLACVWSVKPEWKAAQLLGLIERNLWDRGQTGKDVRFGFGVVDADGVCAELATSA